LNDTETATPDDGDAGSGAPSAPLQRLLHRWFVQYNPLYLLSAALVLVGLTLLSRAAAERGALTAELGPTPLLAEAYSMALIGGAALLTRIGQRRPAVMLGMLTALYQGDLTLLVEREVYLGGAGKLAGAAWIALFVIKLHALAWALRLRLSRSFVGLATAGATGLVLLPHYLARADAPGKDALVAAWLFALAAAGLWRRHAVESKVPLDSWQAKVLRRGVRATWAMWTVLLLLHVSLWSHEYLFGLRALVPAAALLATRWLTTELTVWAAVSTTLGTVAMLAPTSLALASCMGALTLLLRAWSARTSVRRASAGERPSDVYRRPGEGGPAETREPEMVERIDANAAARFVTGAVFALWVGAWTVGYRGGDLPVHDVVLDVGLTLAVVLVAWRARARTLALPLALPYAHGAVQAQLVSAPSSSLEWGVTAVATGFVLLLGSLGLGWRLRDVAEPASDAPPR
jgi:hypothetical protein